MVQAEVGPLSGLTVGRLEPGAAPEVAAWLLAGMGATVLEVADPVSPFVARRAARAGRSECARADLLLEPVSDPTGRPAARLVPSPVRDPAEGVPAGTLSYASGVALALAALAAWRSSTPTEVSELGVAIQIFLPDVMAVSYGAPSWTKPPEPVAAPGGGWLSAELGAAGDWERFDALLSTLPADADAATISAAAQEWRLAVCEYRRRAPGNHEPSHPVQFTAAPVPGRTGRSHPSAHQARATPLAGIAVCDLTAMWAGPLATWLLDRLGATVYKIEPPVRMDGTRAIGGGGIYPQGRQRQPGEDSALWNALNRGKQIAPLDLRQLEQREQFVALARSCDVVIDSFSPRVMPNFGLSHRIRTGPAHPMFAAMPAFPPGPRRDWVAYGTGIHALTGLGDCGDEGYAAPEVTYPDPICGFTGAFAVMAALLGRDRGRPLERVEVALMSATAPLTAFDPAGPLRGGGSAGQVLFDAGLAAGEFASLPVAGIPLMHPKGPFRAVGS
jgi:crotonobetainyl-CoA:carnitine CoA-transferase CaiB-like acyl-CoA transferase